MTCRTASLGQFYWLAYLQCFTCLSFLCLLLCYPASSPWILIINGLLQQHCFQASRYRNHLLELIRTQDTVHLRRHHHSRDRAARRDTGCAFMVNASLLTGYPSGTTENARISMCIGSFSLVHPQDFVRRWWDPTAPMAVRRPYHSPKRAEPVISCTWTLFSPRMCTVSLFQNLWRGTTHCLLTRWSDLNGRSGLWFGIWCPMRVHDQSGGYIFKRI
jgi:hypothetical protein